MSVALAETDAWAVVDRGFPVGETARASFAGLEADVDPVDGRIGAIWEHNGHPACVVIGTEDDREHVVAFERVEMV